MQILFITSTRLGDGVLSTGALDHFISLYPTAVFTVACGPLVAGIFEQAPQVQRVIPLRKEPYAGHWRKLWGQVVGTHWDIIIDLRNTAVSRLIRGKQKFIWGQQDESKHKIEQIAEVIGASNTPPAPRLWFNTKTSDTAEQILPKGTPILAIGPAANWPAKTWPAVHFIELIHQLTQDGGIMAGWRVAIFAAPGEEATATKVLQALPIERRIDLIAKTSPVLAAACLARCQFYIGNDSGLMHSAAATGIPTLGLFGPSWPHLYRPWGPHCAYVSTPESFSELTNYQGYDPKTAPCLMTTLTTTAALAAAVDLFQKTRRA